MLDLTNSSNAHYAVVLSCLGRLKFMVKLDNPNAEPGRRYGYVLNESGEIVGDASDWMYCGLGFAIHTAAYGGFVDTENIVFV